MPDCTALIVAAHPDDETIGMAGQLPGLARRAVIVHVTNGAPRNPADAHAAGFASGEKFLSSCARFCGAIPIM